MRNQRYIPEVRYRFWLDRDIKKLNYFTKSGRMGYMYTYNSEKHLLLLTRIAVDDIKLTFCYVIDNEKQEIVAKFYNKGYRTRLIINKIKKAINYTND